MQVIIINGPNLNLLGKREPDVYGKKSFDQFFNDLVGKYLEHELTYFQSNIEGELITKIQDADQQFDGVILNPGGYSHTSVALSDAIAAVEIPVVEVHISNIYEREDYRHTSLTGKNCAGIITGFGLQGYEMALDYFIGQIV